jgi:hypothetical protein
MSTWNNKMDLWGWHQYRSWWRWPKTWSTLNLEGQGYPSLSGNSLKICPAWVVLPAGKLLLAYILSLLMHAIPLPRQKKCLKHDDWTILMKRRVKIIILYGICWQTLWSDLFEKQKMNWCYDIKIVIYSKAVRYTKLTQDEVHWWALMTLMGAFITTRNFLTFWVGISCWKKALYRVVGW